MTKLLRNLVLSSLYLFSFDALASQNEIELILYRAPVPLDWSTPDTLSSSTVNNSLFMIGYKDLSAKPNSIASRGRQSGFRYQFYPHPISHVNVKIQCEGEEPIYRGAGASKTDFSYIWDMFINGKSLDFMITPVNGHYYTNKEILQWLPILKEQGYVRSLRLKVNDGQCQRAKKYWQDFHAMGQDKIYGALRSDPLLGQGAGCSAFALSFLKILGVLRDDIAKHWVREINVPLDLMTTRSRIANDKTGRAWAQDNEPHTRLKFYDPEKIYNWIGGVVSGKFYLENVSHIERQGAFLAIEWDIQSYPDVLTSPFPLGYDQTKLNTQLTIKRADSFLDERDLQNPTRFECQFFNLCNLVSPLKMF